MNETELKREVLAVARSAIAADLNRGEAGNVSVRCGDGFIVSPTGLRYADCADDDMVFVTLDGTPRGKRTPSSEWRIHRDIYRARPEAGAVLHAHAPFATSLACLEMGIPAFHYMVARFGGIDVRCARYATFGTQALSDAITEAMQDRCACLMAHHGLVVFGDDLHHAFDLAVELETLAEQYWRALQVGQPRLLGDAEMNEVLALFKNYGRQ